ncbi:MAG: hypothetical protein U1F14_07370 [Steroidobacteraceae bacterium]
MLLADAATDLRPGHEPSSTWFRLWSALCHQGDAYSASYAAVPELVRLAQTAAYRDKYDPLLLAAHIELARLEGTGPELPDDYSSSYEAALKRGIELAAEALKNETLDLDSIRAFRGCVAAFRGELRAARDILDPDDESAV